MRRRIWIGVLAAALAAWGLGAHLAMAQDDAAATEGEGDRGEVNVFDWFVVKGGPIGWLLLLIEAGSWALIIEHFITIRRANILPDMTRMEIERMLDERDFKGVLEYTAQEPSALSAVVHEALGEAGHGYGAMTRALEEANEERTSRLLRKIEPLNLIGNVAPMLGLMGTVLGMILAFSSIVAEKTGTPNPGKLAGSIGMALTTTFWGLVIAVPALAVHAWLRNRIDALSTELAMQAQEMIAAFRPGRKQAGGQG